MRLVCVGADATRRSLLLTWLVELCFGECDRFWFGFWGEGLAKACYCFFKWGECWDCVFCFGGEGVGVAVGKE